MKLLDPILYWFSKYKVSDIKAESKWNEFIYYLEEFLASFTEYECIKVDSYYITSIDSEYIDIKFKNKKLYRRKTNYFDQTEYHLTKILPENRKKAFKNIQVFLKKLAKQYKLKSKTNLEILKILKNF
jgi:hypothetical protein